MQPTPSVLLQVQGVLPDCLPQGECLVEALRGVLELVVRKLPLGFSGRDVELSVTITDDPSIRAVNRTYRNVDSATDVLSFPMLANCDGASPETGTAPLVLGDIVISMDTVMRQSRERNMSAVERFAECFVHGLLHLLGYEHSTARGREEMETLEDSLVPEAMALLERKLEGERLD